MHDDDRTAAEWAARVDLDTLAAALSIPNQDTPTARAARAEWDRRTNDAHTLRAAAPRCYCPDDCACHYPWRPNVCGCKAHAAPAAPPYYFMRDRDETMTNADGEPLVLAIRHAEHAAPLYETPDAPTASERIRRRREARAAVTGGIVIPPDCTGYEDELGFLAHDGDTCPVHEGGLDIGDGDPGEQEPRATVTLYAEEPGATLEVVRGQYVVFDPTGRDLPDCFIVGKVERIDSEGFAIVKPNSPSDTGERFSVSRLAAVLTA